MKGVWPSLYFLAISAHKSDCCIEMASRKRSLSVAESSVISSQKVRRLSRATFDKSKRKNEVSYQTMTWLCCELERDKGFVTCLHCSVCKRFEHIYNHKGISLPTLR